MSGEPLEHWGWTWRAHVVWDVRRQDSRLFLIGTDRDGQMFEVTAITVSKFEPNVIRPDEGFAAGFVQQPIIQAIVDAAWEAGIRPSCVRDTSEQVKALGHHLDDMRAIAFGKLNLEPAPARGQVKGGQS